MLEAQYEPIAIVGIGCRFPGAHGPKAFWELLRDGRDAISEVPADRWLSHDLPAQATTAEAPLHWGGFIDDIEQFDWRAFRLLPREIRQMDPQHRLLLEVAWEALEDAGLPLEQIAGSKAGVYIGIGWSDYLMQQAKDWSRIDAYTATGGVSAFAANRLSYTFDLKGPSMAIDAGCTSSLATLYLACQGLWTQETDLALVGGVHVMPSPDGTLMISRAGLLSPDGHCKTLDAEANGFVRGEGAGIVVLKRLSHIQSTDRVYALIRGISMSHNGHNEWIIASSQEAQEVLLREAYLKAGVAPSEVDYLELHGTGFRRGDMIEAKAAGNVLGGEERGTRFCMIGSVKTNIGHLAAAAGVASLIKVALSLHHREIPPTLHVKTRNPEIPFQALRLDIPQQRLAWPDKDGVPTAGVSTLSLTGANAHAILEAFPQQITRTCENSDQWRLLPLSARTSEALLASARSLRDFLLSASSLSWQDICYTAGVRRTHHEYRLAIAAPSAQEAGNYLETFLREQSPARFSQSEETHKLIFLFAHKAPISPFTRDSFLWQEEAFRASMEKCDHIYYKLTGTSILPTLAQTSENACEHNRHDPVAQFLWQVALVALWRSWGIEPCAVLSEGFGDLAALYTAGGLSLPEALKIAQAFKVCQATGQEFQLPVETAFAPVTIPLYQTSGFVLEKGDSPSIAHWSTWPRNSTLSTEIFCQLTRDHYDVFLALNNPSSLFGAVYAHLTEEEISHERYGTLLASLRPDETEGETLLQAAGKLYTLGYSLSWQTLAGQDGRCISLPTYPWQRERLWPDWMQNEKTILPALEYKERGDQPLSPHIQASMARPLEDILTDLWAEVLELEGVNATDSFFESGGHSLLAAQLLARIQANFQVELSLSELLQSATPAACAALITHKRASSEAEDSIYTAITHTPGERYQPFPLTEVQQVYWVGRNAAFAIGNVGNHGYIEVEGRDLNIRRFDQALQTLVGRHDMMRAVILPDGQQQVLAQVPHFPITTIDLRSLASTSLSAQLMLLRHAMDHEILPVDNWPSFKICLSLLDHHRVRIHLSVESLFFDAWSMNLLIQEFLYLYTESEATLPTLNVSFRDYLLAEQNYHHTQRYQRDRDYWLKRLPDLPPAPDLPITHAEQASPRFVHRSARLERTTWQQVKARAAQAKLTPSGFLLAAFSEIVATWSKSSRFSLNLSTFNRLPWHPQVNEIVGDFTSLLIVAVDCRASETFEQRAQRLQAQLWQDLDHGSFSGVHVLRELARSQGDMTRAIMPIVFTSLLIQDTASRYPPPWEETIYCVSQTPQVWLDHQVVETDGALVFHWESVDALFPDGLIDAMFEAYQRLLQLLASEESAWQSVRLPLLPPQQVFNELAQPLSDELLHTLFMTQAKQHPQHLAVITPTHRLTYRQVENGMRQLAWQLRELEATPGQLVGVVMEKGWEQVVAVLGILLSGAAYLPIDATLPEERLMYLLRHGDVRIVLTQSHLEKKGALPADIHTIYVDSLDLEKTTPSLTSVQQPEDLAYVIYTSGSTGLPKGVMINHRGAVNTILDLNQRFHIQSSDRVLALSALNFDLSVYDIFGLLAAGGTIVMPAESNSKNPAAWIDLLVQEQITLWNTVPALLQMLVDYAEAFPHILKEAHVRLAFLSGDWIPLSLPESSKRLLPEVNVISMGGATEASIWSIIYPISTIDPGWKSIPYGRAMMNQRFYVLNERLEPCPTWVVGQLYIGGIGLALGYWRDTEKTASSFFHHPRTGERLYRTGDLGRYLPDGNIEFLGREDFQVKIRGYRIELGEIEETLRQHPRVQAAVANAVAGTGHEKRLVAYVVLSPPSEETSRSGYTLEQLQVAHSSLAATLPEIEPLHVRPDELSLKSALAVQFGQATIRHELDGPVISLTQDVLTPEALTCYRRRLSSRVFQQKRIALTDFSKFLAALCQREIEGLPKYRYPSAGGIYPVQIYLSIKHERIEGIAGGLYYYRPDTHQLILLSKHLADEGKIHASINQPIAEGSAFSLFLVGQIREMTSKYGAAAHDFCLLEAGYISQLLMTVAPDSQLGLCPIGGLDFDVVRQKFQLDDGHVFLHCLLGGSLHPATSNGWSFLPTETMPASITSRPAQDTSTTARDLLAFLRGKLPEYMVPSTIMILDALPLTSNGKIDRKNLPAPDEIPEKQTQVYRAPLSDLERLIASVWQEELPTARIGTNDTFFDLGGTSLLMVRSYTKLKKALDTDLSITEMFFQYPTIQSLAQFLSKKQSARAEVEEEAEAMPRQRESHANAMRLQRAARLNSRLSEEPSL